MTWILFISMGALFLTELVPITPVLKMCLMCGTQAARLCGAREKRQPQPNRHQCVGYIHRATGKLEGRAEYSFRTTTFGVDESSGSNPSFPSNLGWQRVPTEPAPIYNRESGSGAPFSASEYVGLDLYVGNQRPVAMIIRRVSAD